jgi:outer membrane protein assembly factor BamB
VYIAASSGILYALDRETLKPVWEQSLGTRAKIFSSPVVGRGRVYVGTQNDGFLAVGRLSDRDGEEKPLWAGPLGGPRISGNSDQSPLPPRGEFQWQFPANQTGNSTVAVVQGTIAVAADKLLVPLAGEAQQCGLACLSADTTDGKPPAPDWLYHTANPVVTSPVVSGGVVFCVDGVVGIEDRRLYAVDRASGKPLWTQAIARDASGMLSCTRTEVFVQNKPGMLSCLTLSGDQIWSREVGQVEFAPNVHGDLIALVTTEPPAVAVLDRPTGQLLWQIELVSPPVGSPLIQGRQIFIATRQGLRLLSLIDGTPAERIRFPNDAVSSPPSIRGERIAYITQLGELVVMTQDGCEEARFSGALAGSTPLLCRNRVLYFSERGVMAHSLGWPDASGHPQPWAELASLGEAMGQRSMRPVTSMVLCRSNVYVGIAGCGLVRLGEIGR